MKKKFVLTLALVLMVAATLVAAPLEVSGDFKAGYVLNFDPKGVTNIFGTDTGEGEIYNVTFSGDFWDVTFADLNFTDAQDTGATADIYLDKALAEQGIDMGDVTLKLSIGDMGNMKPSDVYSDSNDAVAELEMIGAYSSKVTVGYTDMVTVEFGIDPVGADKPILLGATVAPVDGVKAAVGFTTLTINGDKGGLTASALVDVAALAGLDFGLSASAITIYDLNTEKNNMYAEVKASVEDITAWAEYQLDDTTSNLTAKVSYAGIENVGVYAKLGLADLSDATTTISVGGDYTMGGVKYALDFKYIVDGQISLTPSVAISF